MNRTTKLRHRQKGLSAFGWIGAAAIFGLLLISFLKVFPMYYDNFKLRAALESMKTDTAVDPKSKRAIWTSLQKRLFIDDVRRIQREHVKMVRKDGKTTVTVSYEAQDDYFGNLFIGARFSESVVIDR